MQQIVVGVMVATAYIGLAFVSKAVSYAPGDAWTVWLCDGIGADFDRSTEVVRAVLVGERVPPERLALLADDVLPEWPDEWVVPVRFLHRQLRLLALERARDASVTTPSQRC